MPTTYVGSAAPTFKSSL